MRTCLVSGSGLFAILALAACGGTIDIGPAPCENSGPTTCSTIDDPKPETDALPSSSSKLLVFDTVTRSDGMSASYSVPLPTERASIGNEARLDIDAQLDPPAAPLLKVTLAPRWGAVTELVPATTIRKKLVLNGKITFSSSGEQNEWTSITLDLDAKGELAGTFTAVGTLQVFAGDVGDSYPVTGTATSRTTRSRRRSGSQAPGRAAMANSFRGIR